MKKAIFKSLICVSALYLLQYIILPSLGIGENITGIPLIIIFVFIQIVFLSAKFWHCILSDVLYFILVSIYHPSGIYNIGLPLISIKSYHFEPDESQAYIGIFILTITLFILQFLGCALFELCKVIYKKMKARKEKKQTLL